MTVKLHGYSHSVYSWIARLALHEKGVGFEWIEVDPFADDVPADYLAMHPFKRVPTLVDGDFVIFETSAITRYVDEAFEGPGLRPVGAKDQARVDQILSVVDSYVYWPLVRQIFSHGFFRPRFGIRPDQSEYRRGLEAAPRILGALDRLVGGPNYLVADQLSLADIHLAPMIAYFACDSGGKVLLRPHSRLDGWWSSMSRRKNIVETRPALLGSSEE